MKSKLNSINIYQLAFILLAILILLGVCDYVYYRHRGYEITIEAMGYERDEKFYEREVERMQMQELVDMYKTSPPVLNTDIGGEHENL